MSEEIVGSIDVNIQNALAILNHAGIEIQQRAFQGTQPRTIGMLLRSATGQGNRATIRERAETAVVSAVKLWDTTADVQDKYPFVAIVKPYVENKRINYFHT